MFCAATYYTHTNFSLPGAAELKEKESAWGLRSGLTLLKLPGNASGSPLPCYALLAVAQKTEEKKKR